MLDLVIIGGGPGGSAAAVYAARKLLKTALITPEFGGQSIVSADIENWIGIPHISGEKLAKDLEAHVRAYAQSIDIVNDRVSAIAVSPEGAYSVTTKGGTTLETRAVLIATGGVRRTLEAPGAKEFDQKGLTYCASCDGPLFANQDVAVVGGGNAGFETAAQLLAYCKSVTLFQNSDSYTADPVTVEKVLAHPHMRGHCGVKVTGVVGEKFVTGITYTDNKTGMETTLPVTGIFVEIGLVPSTDYVPKEMVDKDQYGRVIVDPRTQRTSMAGIWAAGDCTNGLYHQNNIAMGDAVKALEDIYLYLNAR